MAMKGMLLGLGICLAATTVSGSAVFEFDVLCFNDQGAQFSCGDIVFTETVAAQSQSNSGAAAFTLIGGGGFGGGNTGGVILNDNNTVGGGLSNSSTPTGDVNASNACPIQAICDCQATQLINIVSGVQDASGLIACNGFVTSNTTAIQELENISSSACAIEITVLVNVTQSGTPAQENVTLCFSDPTLVTPEDNCNDNTAVIVIIILCLIMLLIVLVVGAYYLVHGKALQERPLEAKTVENPNLGL
mmetsp:Transcript_8707/g.22531  ORF Transcript_8707/g.22531 Transcript_8707/m.22531 type:complete len:247 (-) Transcript_8707:73-813(-)